MKTKKWLTGVALIAVLQAGAVLASDTKPIVKADTKDNFEAVVSAIHQQMAPGGRWAYVDRSERQSIDTEFADMRDLFSRYGSVAQMDQAAQQQLYKDQEIVNGILTRRDGNRLICRNEAQLGSHIPVRTCKTYSQIEAQHSNSQRFFQDIGSQSHPTAGGG
ncbi:MAG TPA: hypothetical protein VFP88_09575 [Rhodanobacteraceae bacterium]|nr:hypothetical protein [Rhodanobacteraceae bacterium]